MYIYIWLVSWPRARHAQHSRWHDFRQFIFGNVLRHSKIPNHAKHFEARPSIAQTRVLQVRTYGYHPLLFGLAWFGPVSEPLFQERQPARFLQCSGPLRLSGAKYQAPQSGKSINKTFLPQLEIVDSGGPNGPSPPQNQPEGGVRSSPSFPVDFGAPR